MTKKWVLYNTIRVLDEAQVGGKKFDMRIYAFVASFIPLKVYLHRSGFARFSASHYSSDPSDIENNFVHLTNVAIQKVRETSSSCLGRLGHAGPCLVRKRLV